MIEEPLTIDQLEWSWSGWDEGEELDPPEPGKLWLTIYHWGEEYATIVHRKVDRLDNQELMRQKEQAAMRIVAALRLESAVVDVLVRHESPDPPFERPA